MACGTGLWTQHLAPHANRLVALDAPPTSLELNRRRLAAFEVEYQPADLFVWKPAERFDYIFFGFWLSHVPPERFEEFWGTVSAALTPGGKVFFVDSLPEQTSTAKDHEAPDYGGRARRELNDGSE